MTEIRLVEITKRFTRHDDSIAVRDANLTVSTGEFFTLLGPSGCGKTTTLRMVAGFYYPTSGQLYFDEDEVTRRPPHRRGTGMVFQNYALFPHLSVAENVAYGLRVRKVDAADRRKRIEEALSQVHLSGYESRRIDQLSGGQQQRVALARALVIRPRVLLLDEPLSNLDAKLREETRREIRRIQVEAGTTALYVTHDQAEAMAVSDRIAVMEAGRVHQVGAPKEIYNEPRTAFVARFIGNSNVLTGDVIGGDSGRPRLALSAGDRTIEFETTLPEHVESQERIQLAIRPEHLTITTPGTPNALPASVTAVEFTGLTTTVTAQLGDTVITIALVDADGAPEVGETILVKPNLDRIRAVSA
ncbi:iron(III) transport system ATP-binding protein [Stackebrandtia endophytica]|uniref:ABC-type quaternary amine transporter n=1 Tax=Stackebrandtia endophytica TaxID=1496996 RepID=A0A543ASQ7_9ACTN|nr:ABC transporter ATP-binding protein [Stackebrandtia endophytica]TQL75619.1 iron(III) transport system ATP-binding protein [Stackebrandtia endophytica]